MKKNELQKLAADIKAAEDMAQKYANTEDGGTSNFDAPMVYVKSTEKQLQTVCRVVMQHGKKQEDGCAWFVLMGLKTSGQGNRNTRMAETITNHLAKCGWRTSMYYNAD